MYPNQCIQMNHNQWIRNEKLFSVWKLIEHWFWFFKKHKVKREKGTKETPKWIKHLKNHWNTKRTKGTFKSINWHLKKVNINWATLNSMNQRTNWTSICSKNMNQTLIFSIINKMNSKTQKQIAKSEYQKHRFCWRKKRKHQNEKLK